MPELDAREEWYNFLSIMEPRAVGGSGNCDKQDSPAQNFLPYTGELGCILKFRLTRKMKTFA
jgi:hypothetical protein